MAERARLELAQAFRPAALPTRCHTIRRPLHLVSNLNIELRFEKSLAERVGFEPTVPVKVQRFSRPPDSTTLAPLRK